MTRSLLLPFAVAMLSTATAQWDTIDYAVPDTSMVRYEGGFDFREGIYFSFEDFRANRPAVALKDLLNEQGEPADDLRNYNGKLYYRDSTYKDRGDTIQRIGIDDSVWGFCDHDIIYVRIGGGFSRIGMMGAIAHIVYDNTYSNRGGYYDGMYMGSTTTTVQEQRLLDLETGSVLPVTAGGICQAMQRDPDLRAEFEALPKKDRNRDETIFRFIRRYNERHPLYFPN